MSDMKYLPIFELLHLPKELSEFVVNTPRSLPALYQGNSINMYAFFKLSALLRVLCEGERRYFVSNIYIYM